MGRKLTSLLLVLALLGVLPGTGVASEVAAGESQAEAASKIKARVAELSAHQAEVKLKLREGKKLAGRISEVGEESFVLTEAKSGARTTVAYAEVAEIKESVKGSKWWIVAAVAVSVAAVAIVAAAVGGKDIDIQ